MLLKLHHKLLIKEYKWLKLQVYKLIKQDNNIEI
jgi:hypothetical protein